MPKSSVKTQVTVVKTTTLKINADDIRAFFGLPDTARITFHVPGGGDWCNVDVDVDDENPITATWTERVEEDKTDE